MCRYNLRVVALLHNNLSFLCILLQFFFFKEDILYLFCIFDFDFFSSTSRHSWPNSKVSRSSENCDLCPLSSLYFLHSLKMVCVTSSSPIPSSAHASALHCTHNPFCPNMHKINIARTLADEMLLTVCASHSSAGPSNAEIVPSFSRSLAVNPT